MKNFLSSLTKPTSIYPLVVFRMAFGLMMLISTVRFVWMGWIEDHYINPKMHFHFYGFDWVRPLGLEGMYAVHILMIIASTFIILGLFYRASTLSFAFLFTYTELIDITYYLNHYYFVSIVSFAMVFLPAHRYFSLDVWRKPSIQSTQVPMWCISLIKFQLGLTYFYAGVAKLNHDWMIEALPLKIWLPAHHHVPLLGSLLRLEETAYFFSWAGMLYDCTIPFFLLWRKSRPWAYIAVIFFHLMTGYLFQIGMFPIIMIFATLIFFSDSFHYKIIQSLRRLSPLKEVSTMPNKSFQYPFQNIALAFVMLFLLFQLLFPWRYLLYKDSNIFWSEEGYRFSWRVMLVEKSGYAVFYVKDADTGVEGEVYNPDFLNKMQEKQMSFQPDLILKYAKYLQKIFRQQGIKDPIVRAEVYVSMNGRLGRLYFDPKLDLTEVEDGWGKRSWIYPLAE